MQAKSPMLLAFLCVFPGCAAPAARKSASPAAENAASPARTPAAAPVGAAAPAETLAEADRAYDARLAASRGQFDTERQIAVLRQAVLLYSQFLERAAGHPELEPAIRKSRERIVDANDTIEFLLASLKPDAEPPLAPTRAP